jgi:hypothetical protein
MANPTVMVIQHLGKKSIQSHRDIPDVLRHIIKNVSKRLNAETGGSKTSYTLGCAGKHMVNLVLVVSQKETAGLVRRSRNQST